MKLKRQNAEAVWVHSVHDEDGDWLVVEAPDKVYYFDSLVSLAEIIRAVTK